MWMKKWSQFSISLWLKVTTFTPIQGARPTQWGTLVRLRQWNQGSLFTTVRSMHPGKHREIQNTRAQNPSVHSTPKSLQLRLVVKNSLPWSFCAETCHVPVMYLSSFLRHNLTELSSPHDRGSFLQVLLLFSLVCCTNRSSCLKFPGW
jgi:hypothetical protein